MEQKTAGQNLLCNLADILCIDNENTSGKKQSTSSEDSCQEVEERGKSCFEINPEEEEEEKTVDLFMKRKTLSHSFSFPSQKMPGPKLSNTLKARAETMKSITTSVGGNNSRVNGLSKLKPQKVEEKVKKGPLRAIIPVNVMAKKKEAEVKPKSRLSKIEQTLPRKHSQENVPKYKKVTSTPVPHPKLKPMAQSTPDDDEKKCSNNNNTQIKRKFSCPGVSDVSLVNEGLNGRISSSDLKAPSGIKPPLKRSYSISKENHLSSLRKPAGWSKPIMENVVEDKKKSIGSTKDLLKPFNLMSKLKPNKK